MLIVYDTSVLVKIPHFAWFLYDVISVHKFANHNLFSVPIRIYLKILISSLAFCQMSSVAYFTCVFFSTMVAHWYFQYMSVYSNDTVFQLYCVLMMPCVCDSSALRTWQLQVSKDGTAWTTTINHENDKSLNEAG